MVGRHDSRVVSDFTLVVTLFVGLTLLVTQVGSWISHYSSADELLKRLEQGCLVAVDVGAYASNRGGVGRLLEGLAAVLAGKIAFGVVALSDIGSSRRVALYLDGKRPAWPRAKKGSGLVVFEQLRVDRSCLLKDVVGHKKLLAAEFVGLLEAVAVMDFINDKCDTCWTEEGNLSRGGVARARLLSGLFGVAELNSTVSSGELARRCGNLSEFFYTERCVAQEEYRLFGNERGKTCDAEERPVELPKCEELHSLPSPEEFFQRYLSKSKPVILKGAAQDWPAKLKWSNTFFRERFGDETVHVKLVPPKGTFEGVEHRSLWNISLESSVPRVVLDSLVTSDLLVVRPDGVQLKLAEFLNIIEDGTRHTEMVSAYLEYTSLEEVFPGCGQLIMGSRQRKVFGLHSDLREPLFAKELLQLDLLNIWLSDGNTLGKLHFDQYDNLLCQLSGHKQLIVYEPHQNANLYEGHILEAKLKFREKNGSFTRDRLMRSTALTMSPIDIVDPDFQKFPKFDNTLPLNCTIGEGDILYLPAFWWHEVQSYPNRDENRNLAVNYWYKPFLTKEFPCAECRLTTNNEYRNLLAKYL